MPCGVLANVAFEHQNLTSKDCLNRKLANLRGRTMEPSSLPVFITTGCKDLDDLLGGGGVETGKVTEISGHPLTMLRLCHALCVTTQLPIVATANAAVTDAAADVYTPGRHYGLKVFGGGKWKGHGDRYARNVFGSADRRISHS
eukprot:COSAG02_NODE_4259_length_5577_cov_12.639102_4_plen_144_part_00